LGLAFGLVTHMTTHWESKVGVSGGPIIEGSFS
jgi:hypothetical protein